MFSIQPKVKWVESPFKLVGIVEKANKKAVMRSGAKIRGFMRRSIRSRKRRTTKSKPGKPPYSHTGQGFGLRHIVYRYFESFGFPGMQIGPIIKSGDVPGLIEFGGLVQVPRDKKGTVITARLDPRPFARPALEAYKAKYPEEWRNIIG